MMQGYTIIGRLGNGRTSICYEAKNDQGIRFALNKMRVNYDQEIDFRDSSVRLTIEVLKNKIGL